MNDRGQIFTFDMLLAMILLMLVTISSGYALNMVNDQSSEYVSRYSLDREAQDIANALIRSPGMPSYWEENDVDMLVPGFAKLDQYDQPISHYLDIIKLSQFASKIGYEPIDENIKKFFGGTTNFEIEISRNENAHLRIWPGWKNSSKSGVENALEVVTVERIVYGTGAEVRAETPPLIRATGRDVENLWFRINAGELDAFNWYIYAENLVPFEMNYNIDVYVNHTQLGGGHVNYNFHKNQIPIPGQAPKPPATGGIENDTDISTTNQLKVGMNFIHIKMTAVPGVNTVKFYIIAIPEGSPEYEIVPSTERISMQLKLKMWR